MVKYDLQSYIFYNEKFNEVVLEYCEGDNLFYLKIYHFEAISEGKIRFIIVDVEKSGRIDIHIRTH